MSRTYKDAPSNKEQRGQGRGRQRHISVRGVRKTPPDLRKLSRALIQLALEEAQAEAAAAQQTAQTDRQPGDPDA